MNRSHLKKFFNEKVYSLSKLKLPKKGDSPQSEIDNILNTFDENEPTFNDLEEA